MLLWLAHYWELWFAEPLRKVEADSLAYRLSDAGRRTDWKTITVLISAAACLILQQYTSHPARVATTATFVANMVGGPESEDAVRVWLNKWSNDTVLSHLWWAAVAVLTYMVIPMLILRLVLRERFNEHGLKVRGIYKLWPVYVLFVAVMVPLVIIFSNEERFQQTYPFMRVAKERIKTEQWKWELAYAAQFVALEFFFRGFMVHGTKHRFGAGAVFVSMVPYVQIHFGKPLPEACASVIAGVALGYMSLITRSVWLGAALHIGVAWGMDFACLYRRGLL